MHHELLSADIELLGEKWASHAYELGPGLATLNYLATTLSENAAIVRCAERKQQGYRELGILMDDLQSVGFADYKDGILTFEHESARRFANGEWLEWYVHQTVKNIQQEMPTIQDLSLGLQVYRQSETRKCATN